MPNIAKYSYLLGYLIRTLQSRTIGHFTTKMFLLSLPDQDPPPTTSPFKATSNDKCAIIFHFSNPKRRAEEEQARCRRKEGKLVSMPKMLLTAMTCENRRNLWSNQMDTYSSRKGSQRENRVGGKWKCKMYNSPTKNVRKS